MNKNERIAKNHEIEALSKKFNIEYGDSFCALASGVSEKDTSEILCKVDKNRTNTIHQK